MDSNLIPYEPESKNKLDAALFSSIESVVQILSTFQNRKSETEKFRPKNFFSEIETKRMPYERESKTELKDTCLSSIDRVVLILSQFQVLQSRQKKFDVSAKNFFSDIETKRIPYEPESKTEFDNTCLTPIEPPVMILSKFEVRQNRHRKNSMCQEDVKKFFLDIAIQRIS